jgi:sugar transferase (PEP-CTERM/EpsH1 system associated)
VQILFVTPNLPYPPHQGGAIRIYGFLKELHKAGHEITLLSFLGEDTPLTPDNPLNIVCKQIITLPTPAHSLAKRVMTIALTNKADIANRLYDATMEQTLLDQLAQHPYDLIQIEGIEVGSYLLAAKSHFPQIPIVYDAHNAETDLQRFFAEITLTHLKQLPSALYSRIQSQRIELFERELITKADKVVSVSEEDQAILRRLSNMAKVEVVPNGIFTADYEPTVSATHLELKPNALVFTGKMDYRPNIDAVMWFVDEVLPLIERYTHVHFYIVGQKPHPRLEALRSHPNVTLTGWVPEILPYLLQSSLYVAPLRIGSGTRLKLLEAMAAKCAIVATPIAASGLGNQINNYLTLADKPQEFANSVLELLQDPTRRQTMGAKAHEYVNEHYDWSVIAPRLLKVYAELG